MLIKEPSFGKDIFKAPSRYTWIQGIVPSDLQYFSYGLTFHVGYAPFYGEGLKVLWVPTLHLGEEFAKGSYRRRESHMMGVVYF